ncbi:MAG: hypothetical protein ACYCX4_09100 [Bacillota bacterium]
MQTNTSHSLQALVPGKLLSNIRLEELATLYAIINRRGHDPGGFDLEQE